MSLLLSVAPGPLEQTVFSAVNGRWHGAPADLLMAVMSSFDFWLPFLIAAVLAVFFLGGAAGRRFLVCLGLVLVLTDGLLIPGLKKWVHRPRPAETQPGVRTVDLARAHPRFLALGQPVRVQFSTPAQVRERGQSLPSGHVTDNFAAATLCASLFRRRGWLLFLPASLVAYSRVYVGSHWPGDVLLSMFLGAGGVVVVLAALSRLALAPGRAGAFARFAVPPNRLPPDHR